MSEQNFQPEKITKPIQLTAVWFLSLLVLDSAFFVAAGKITKPEWVPPLLVISAVALVPIFLTCVFLFQTTFRKELQEDKYYSEMLKRNEARFSQFKPENSTLPTKKTAIKGRGGDGTDELEKMRIKKYETQEGLFLIHNWRPSKANGQVADVMISLFQHGEGPLSKGIVKKVEYELGRKFFPSPQVRTNEKNNFRLEISAYSPMLCIAKVFINDTKEPIILERYIDFDSL